MRTLDEVIKAVEEDLERANVSYPETFYDYDNHKDALHYLRELRQNLAELGNPDGDHHQLLKCQALLQELYRNEPLTMEYFSKQIDTEPIWCEKLDEWYLFLAYDDGENKIQLMSDKGNIETFDEEDLEKYPLYRRK